MIHQKSKNFTLVIYDEGRAPRCFKFSKSTLKTCFFLLPSLLVLAIFVVLILLGQFKQIVVKIKKNEPVIIQELKDQKQSLMDKQGAMEKMNTTLLAKINAAPEEGKAQGVLPLLVPGINHKDMTPSSPIDIQDFRVRDLGNLIQVNFNLANKSLGKKISGYIFVLANQKNIIQIYPAKKKAKKGDNKEISNNFSQFFNEGESFAFSRFRPVQASFQKLRGDEQELHLKIYIFSPLGDLIYQKTLSKTI